MTRAMLTAKVVGTGACPGGLPGLADDEVLRAARSSCRVWPGQSRPGGKAMKGWPPMTRTGTAPSMCTRHARGPARKTPGTLNRSGSVDVAVGGALATVRPVTMTPAFESNGSRVKH